MGSLLRWNRGKKLKKQRVISKLKRGTSISKLKRGVI